MATVIRTDTAGRELGVMEAVAAHTGGGTLHKAFSVYLFTPDRKKILLQKRSEKKMLWPDAWANTCCSHPRPGEMPEEAGARRLREELGTEAELTESGSYVYRAEDPSGKGVEHEFVTLLVGVADETLPLKPNPDEVAATKWIAVEDLLKDMKEHPFGYAPWLPLGLERIIGSHG